MGTAVGMVIPRSPESKLLTTTVLLAPVMVSVWELLSSWYVIG